MFVTQRRFYDVNIQIGILVHSDIHGILVYIGTLVIVEKLLGIYLGEWT